LTRPGFLYMQHPDFFTERHGNGCYFDNSFLTGGHR